MARFGRRSLGYYGEYSGRWGWAPRPDAASRRATAARAVAALEKSGRKLSPVVLEPRKSGIARTFWGKAWCENLERYSDYENRLPRGRTYVRSGSVVDLQIQPGQVTALVQGSSLYHVTIAIGAVAPARWKRLVKQCAGGIDSVIELLQGNLSTAVMAAMTRADTGLFPEPATIRMSCSCPDWAAMCKHVAAVLYGIGARLDHAPELLFRLRGADPSQLVATAAKASIARRTAKVAKDRPLGGADLGSVFGIDLDTPVGPPARPSSATRARPPKRDKPLAIRKTPVAKPETPSTKRKSRAETVTRADLVRLGVTAATLRRWLTAGVLLATPRLGVYEKTAKAKQRLDEYRAR